MYYYAKENPTELYYEGHQMLVGQAKSASLAREVQIRRAQPKRSSTNRAVVATLGFFAAALMAV